MKINSLILTLKRKMYPLFGAILIVSGATFFSALPNKVHADVDTLITGSLDGGTNGFLFCDPPFDSMSYTGYSFSQVGPGGNEVFQSATTGSGVCDGSLVVDSSDGLQHTYNALGNWFITYYDGGGFSNIVGYVYLIHYPGGLWVVQSAPPLPTDTISRITFMSPAEGARTASSTFGFTVCAIRGTDFSSPVDPSLFLYPQLRIHFNPLESVYAGPDTSDYFVDLTVNDGCYVGTTTPPLPTGYVQMTASFWSVELGNARASTTQFIVVESYADEQNEIYQENVSDDCTTATGVDKIICGLGSAITSPFRFLFQPSNASLAQFSDYASSTASRAPFVYAYQSIQIVSLLYDSPASTTIPTSIVVDTQSLFPAYGTSTVLFGPSTVTYLNDALPGLDLWSVIYQIMRAFLYVSAAWACVTMVLHMHQKH